MGSSVGAKKVLEEEKNVKNEVLEKSSKLITRDIFKENESRKEISASQSKIIIESKNSKSDKLTNPIINKNNLQPGKDSSLSRINENERASGFRRSHRNSQQLPSEIKLIDINDEKSGKDQQSKIQKEKEKKDKKEKDKKDIDKKSPEKDKKEEDELLPNEKFILKDETQLFIKTMTENQIKNLENYNKNYIPIGEHIIISLGETFETLNDFYKSLSAEHKLYDEKPIYNFRNFFKENSDGFSIRGIGFNIPSNMSEFYRQSDINTLFQKKNFTFNSTKKIRTKIDLDFANTASLKQFLDINENSKDFIKEFYNYQTFEYLGELIRAEAEKCDNLHCLHFIGDIFDGSSMGVLCNTIIEIQEIYKKTLKLVHLNYYDSLEHRAFNKIKNYIYTVSSLYDKCDLVNFFNSPKGGQIMSNLTVGERISDYEKNYSVNQILSDLLLTPKMNYIYSNGLEIKEKDLDDKYIELLYQDCKESKGHLYYTAQMSSLTIYKGNKIFDDKSKIELSKEMSKIVDQYIKNNRAYYNFYDIKKPFDICDFAANFHQSRYFVRYTEQFFMDFIQNYNFRNFSKEEAQLKEETINNMYGILNEFKELWRYKV